LLRRELPDPWPSGSPQRNAVEADLAKLIDLRTKSAEISPNRDPTLKALVAE
jgi:hypothetical protein